MQTAKVDEKRGLVKINFKRDEKKEQAAAHTHSRIKHLLYVNRSALRFSFHSDYFFWLNVLFLFSFESHGLYNCEGTHWIHKRAQEEMIRAMHLAWLCCLCAIALRKPANTNTSHEKKTLFTVFFFILVFL